MTSEIIAFLGFVFIATTLIAKVCERRQDVLHGPYIEGRNVPHPFRSSIDWLEQVIYSSNLRQSFARLGWQVRNVSYFASAIIC
jgi:hypothetical protein